MKIGNIPKQGTVWEEGHWYVWFEIRRCPPTTIHVFKPYIYFGARKIIDHGEPYKINGRQATTRGFSRIWVLPKGISIEII